MKVRVFHRITSAVIALVLIAAALLLVGIAWDIVGQSLLEQYVSAFYTVPVNTWILTGAACVALLMAIALFFIAFGTDKKVNKYIDIGTAETGVIKIAATTFKEMINKNAMAVTGVKGSKSAIKYEDKNVSVIIKADLEEDVVIPEVCTEIQNQVKTNIEAMSGVTLAKINVLVENEPRK